LSPSNVTDKAYRELRIFEELNKLKEKSEYFPNKESNFVNFFDWWKVRDDMSRDHVMHYVMEYAESTLNDIRLVTLYQYKCILFQILFSLYVAQKECLFVHNDLHLKNILLINHKEEEYISFKDQNIVWYTTGKVVKITDFGLSRIQLDNQRIIYNKKRPETEFFSAHADVEKIFSEFSKIKIQPESWVTMEEVEKEAKRVEKSFLEVKNNLISKKKTSKGN